MSFSSLILAGLLLVSSAHADVGPAPSCPTGLEGAYAFGHYCAPMACSSDDDCPTGSGCEERAFCLAPRSGSTPDALEYLGSCASDGTCESGATCNRQMYCGVVSSSQGHCDAAAAARPSPSASAIGAPLALSFVAAWLVLRRRPHRGS